MILRRASRLAAAALLFVLCLPRPALAQAEGQGAAVARAAQVVAGEQTPAVGGAPTVEAVEFRVEAPPERIAELWALITVEPGEAFDPEELRRSLRNLHVSGLIGEAEAYTRPEGEGIAVVFALWANVRVQEVRLEGQPGLSEGRIRQALPAQVGEPLFEDRVLRGVFRLQDLYREYGYFEATVRVEPRVDYERKEAVLVYRLEGGPVARVGEVAFDGALGPFQPSRLIEQLRAGPGKRYRLQTVREDAERLQGWLIEQGFRLARVGEAAEHYEPAADRVRLAFPVELGPRVEVEIAGADRRELMKKGLLPFLGEEGYDEALVLQAVERITRHYQERGHWKVEVAWREEREEGLLQLLLTVVPGPVFTLEQIRFQGNEEVPESRLRALMTTSERRFLTPGSGRLVVEVLDADLANIRSWYALHGYYSAQVGPHLVEEDGERLSLVLPIEEGPQRRIVQLDLHGVESLDAGGLMGELPIEPGGPYHPRLVEDSLDVIRARYEDEGYTAAQVSASEDWNAERTLVDLTLRVLEGPRQTVDRVILRGNERTHSEVVRRSIQLGPGDPVSTRQLLEVQRRLYGLGIFSRVEVELAPGAPYAAARDVMVRVEEGKNQKVTYGVGWDSEDGVRGIAGYSHGNLLGRAISGQVDLRASQRERLARLLLRQPYLLRWPVPVTYSLFRVEEDEESFDSLRRGTQVEALRVFGQQLRLGLLYTYKVVELTGTAPGLEELELDRDLRELEIASITPNLLWDRRDDPVNPTRGWSTNVQAEYAFPLFAADAQFVKLFAQQTAYGDIGRWGVLAGSLRLGAIEPVGSAGVEDTTPILEPFPSRFIPISERFFAGGRTSHRAYDRDSLGIAGETLLLRAEDPDDAVALGGNGLVLLNLDLRFPIAGAFGGTLFFDAGNVWPDWQALDASELKTGAGVGLRYLSPIGPLRVDIGWKLDREPFEDPWVVFLSFGNPF